MTALSAALFLIKWKGALHAIDYNAIYRKKLYPQVPALADLCSEVLVLDSSFTKRIISFLPPQLYFLVMKAAVTKGHDRAMEVLLPTWPLQILSLRQLWPNLYDTLEIVYDHGLHNARMRQGIHSTNSLINAFLSLVKKRESPKLRILDLREFPTVDLVVYQLTHEIILMHHEKQKTCAFSQQLLSNSMISDTEELSQFEIYIDCAVRDEDTFQELCTALRLCKTSSQTLHLHISKIDASCLGESHIRTLLDNLNTDELTGLCIQYNSLSNEGLYNLIPYLKRLKALMALDISCNNFNLPQAPETCALFAEALGNLVNLRRLDISNNRLTGCLHQVLGFLSTKKLDYLKLSACVLIERDLLFLSEAAFTSTLLELDLSENIALSQHINLFSSMINTLSPSLQILELEDCKFNNYQITSIVNAMQKLNNLRYLNFARHALTSNVVCSHLSRLGSLPKLECIRLSYTEDCYLETLETLSYDQRKAVLREHMEKSTSLYRKSLSPPQPDIHFIWTEFISFF